MTATSDGLPKGRAAASPSAPNATIATNGKIRCAKRAEPSGQGTPARRSGWSVSWARPSTASSATTNRQSAATTTSGVIPAQTARSESPAATASTTMRAIRIPGQRSAPSRSRRATVAARLLARTGRRRAPVAVRPGAPAPWPSGARRIRTQGRRRERSSESWRRSRVAVRTSRNVTARRRLPTSEARRSAASIPTPSSDASPIATAAAATATPINASGRTASGQSASSPRKVAGEVRSPRAMSAADQARTRTAAKFASRRESRCPLATSPTPVASTPATTPARAAAATHAGRPPGKRLAASTPPIAPATRPIPAPLRTSWSAGPRSAAARTIGACSTWRTSAASSASGPPRPAERSATATAAATSAPRIAGPSRVTRASSAPWIRGPAASPERASTAIASTIATR
jgi:hypothetical protein